MPVYDYLCPSCGPFTVMRPMAEFAAPHPCAACGAEAPRALLAAPAMSGMDAARKAAFATNERSAHDPARGNRSPSGAGQAPRSGAVRLQPNQRPWMLGH